jgi:hypothetical protein
MKFERTLTDGHGRSFHVVMEVDESGTKFEAAIARLANKARGSSKGTATALDGAVRVTVVEQPR